MSNYYEILGLKTGAGSSEIKAAFRRLAKLYHPDKNPTGKEYFERILRAYEVLSDPISKSNYDIRLKYQHTSAATSATTNTKTWRFDEKEMKRRQYYNEHIRKYAKSAPAYDTETSTKKTYNEYKYVLFATPVAVALFLLIMRLAVPTGIKQPKVVIAPLTPVTAEKTVASAAKTAAMPYADFFGGAGADSLPGASLKINNQSGADVIVCLFSARHFLKSCFISNGHHCLLEHLPQAPVWLRYSSGKNFDPGKKLKQAGTKGAFTKAPRFYEKLQPSHLQPVTEFVLGQGLNRGFKSISEKEFFSTVN